MSRIPRDAVWYNYFGRRPKAPCPCCLKKTIRADGDGADWQRGHIIPHKLGGPDIYENIRPICFQCNQDDKKFETSYHHMVRLGTMKKEEIEPGLKKIRDAQAEYQKHPRLLLCDGWTVSRNMRIPCKNKKGPRSKFCGVHKNNEQYRPLTDEDKTLFSMLKLTKEALLQKDLYDEDELQAWRECLELIKEQIFLSEDYFPFCGVGRL